jgi:hypothetical protein
MKAGRMTYVLFGVCFILFIAVIEISWQGSKIPLVKSLIERQWSEKQAEIEAKHKAEIKVLESKMSASEENLKALSKNYSLLIRKLEAKKKLMDNIKQPANEIEAQKRFEKLGYKVTIK